MGKKTVLFLFLNSYFTKYRWLYADPFRQIHTAAIGLNDEKILEQQAVGPPHYCSFLAWKAYLG